MINTQILINNIVTDMKSQTWTSPSTGGTTSFTQVYDYPNWLNENGFPFLIVLDEPSGGGIDSTQDTEREFTIAFYICAKWPVITGTSDADKRKEAMLRIREAYDFLYEYIVNDNVIESWQSTPNSIQRGTNDSLIWRNIELNVLDSYIDDLNLFQRIIRLPLKDIVPIRS